MAHEHEVRWQSYVGVKYTLQWTEDLVAWATLVVVQGDGSIQSHVDTSGAGKRFYRIIQDIPEGTETQFIAVVAWDGSSVLLEWKPVGSGAVCRVYRNNVLRSTVPSHLTSFRDALVTSGQHYNYSVQVWPP